MCYQSFSRMKNTVLRQTVIDFSNFLQSPDDISFGDLVDYVQI
ncbi:hypothetical protein LEP1GSC036_0122 [Leptospira weilii str. 2006001853]|uniref:Uncharacterized protein n=2 Tax=Leptospira weilii TaxID=28184 RepID=A0A828YWP4_9LEPT|nr:hypothetical protein LEP1GSC036_0122 [Leptospira weilii str. 2006001853]EMN91904.1 hypothetical protein LEP1GSC108_1742 [Leptospira weilii str. UI 13098]